MRKSVFIMHRSILPRRLSLTACRLRSPTANRLSQLRLLASLRSARPAVVFAKVHVQHPVHRLDGPITADRLTESLATEITAENIVPRSSLSLRQRAA